MVKFDIITIFPGIFDSYLRESIIKRARKAELIKINIHNLRDYTLDKHKKVDDTPYGGGAGMVMQIEPVYRCLKSIKSRDSRNKTRTILFSAKGKKYTQSDARRMAKYDNLILICGRYEGVDERVAEFLADEEISIGDYILTGGEIPAMAVLDSVTRLLPGVLGNPESLNEESFSSPLDTESQKLNNNLEYPQYTKPEEFLGHKVPKVLLSGDHKEIRKWREKHSKPLTHNAPRVSVKEKMNG